jgi:hypothetical protein
MRHLLLLSLALSNPASACLHAQQYRIVPLGWSGDNLIVLELNQRRVDGESPHDPPQWTIVPSLVRLDDQLTVLKQYDEVKTTRGSKGTHSQVLLPLVRLGQTDAAALGEFSPAKPIKHERCDFRPHCGELPWTPGAVVYDHFDRYKHHERAPADLDELRKWRVGSTRVFVGGDHRVTVTTLGLGPHIDLEAPNSGPPQAVSLDDVLAEAVFAEPVPHHGMTVDVVKIE